MGIDIATAHLKKWGLDTRIKVFPVSSATVELAATAAGVIPARICKTMSFKDDDGCILIEIAGDAKIDNGRYKHTFGRKAKMLTPDEVLEYTGHAIGGVCAFGIIRADVRIYADVSLKRFTTVFPACGSSNSAVELTPDELFETSCAIDWVDVCKDWDEGLCV